MLQILVFGDSIAYGFWDKEGGWVTRLRKFLDEKSLADPSFYCPIYNLGIDGDTSEDLLKRFKSEVKGRLKENETIIIFAIGINDSLYFQSRKSQWVPPKRFRENLQKLVDFAKKFSSKIIFLGLTSVDETKVDPVPWLPEASYKNEHIRRYNEIIKSICTLNKTYFIDVFGKWINLDYKELLEDGIHPNPQGHKWLFKEVGDFLLANRVLV